MSITITIKESQLNYNLHKLELYRAEYRQYLCMCFFHNKMANDYLALKVIKMSFQNQKKYDLIKIKPKFINGLTDTRLQPNTAYLSNWKWQLETKSITSKAMQYRQDIITQMPITRVD